MTADSSAVVEKYAQHAGFQRAKIEKINGAPELRDAAQYWRADYAQLLVLEIAEPTEEKLREASQLGQHWLDVSCMTRESEALRVIDAYLIILCPEQMPESLFNVVRDIELNPVCCRKHVVWPSEGADPETAWRRLLRVTVLGLPDSPKSTGMTSSPVLASDFAKRLLTDVKLMKGAPAARQHISEIRKSDDVT